MPTQAPGTKAPPAGGLDAVTSPAGAGLRADGRVRRGELNRAAIVEALLALLEAGVARPTAREIALRAGVSLRSVFQHFDDLEALYGAAADRQTQRVLALVDDPPEGAPAETRIEWLAARRSSVFERIAPVRRATILAAGESPELQRRLARAAKWSRDVTASAFAPEVSASPRKAELLAALEAAASWETWDHLRRVQGLSVAAARRVVAALLDGALLVDAGRGAGRDAGRGAGRDAGRGAGRATNGKP